jgi:prepilin-type N-terminal cleavage/methylation domain-containing protein
MTKRKGFSLIELLIVVAIIAALVGVAVPFFQDNLAEAQKTKAKQDLDVIRNAINLHDAQNRPLVGTDLKPLLGRYLQELPADPWGNPYLLDANVGLVISFGADAQYSGTGPDEDHLATYKPSLRIQRAQYEGPWGAPKKKNNLIVTMTKPFVMASDGDLKDTLQVLTNTRDYTSGAPYSLTELFSSGTWAGTSGASSWATITAGAKYNKFDQGMFAFGNTLDTKSGAQPITPTMAVNFDHAADDAASTNFGLIEWWLPLGPLDDAIFVADVRADPKYQRSPEAIPLYQGYNRGVKIERF